MSSKGFQGLSEGDLGPRLDAGLYASSSYVCCIGSKEVYSKSQSNPSVRRRAACSRFSLTS